MTKEDLKTLIRECLVEIIMEGVKPGRPAPLPARARIKESAAVRAAIQDVPRRRTIGGMSLDRPAIQREDAQHAATRVVSKITSDPVLSSIFADTAATTLQEQASAEHMRPGTAADPISAITAKHDPQDLFGDAANNWAALAFSDPPRSR